VFPLDSWRERKEQKGGVSPKEEDVDESRFLSAAPALEDRRRENEQGRREKLKVPQKGSRDEKRSAIEGEGTEWSKNQ